MKLDALTEGLLRKTLELQDTITGLEADAERRAAACREAASEVLRHGSFADREFAIAGEMLTEGRVFEAVRALLGARTFKARDANGGLGPFRFWKRLQHAHDCERRGRLEGDDPLIECTCYLEALAGGNAPSAASKLVHELEWALAQEVQFRPVPYAATPFERLTREAVLLHTAFGGRWAAKPTGDLFEPNDSPPAVRMYRINVLDAESESARFVTRPALGSDAPSGTYVFSFSGFVFRPVDADGLPLRADPRTTTSEAP